MGKKRLFLIDGHSLLYRAYYAIKNLSNSQGFPTNAIFGFLSMMKKLQEKESLTHLGIVFDAKGPTIRHEAFQAYKANRKPMPEDLAAQIPVLKKILEALHIPVLEYEKYEADDVLGSLAKKASAKKIHAVLVSTDKDLYQLVDESTTLYDPAKEIHMDKKAVEKHFGVLPSQVVDVLALWGDSSDNIPGVPGVGEKTSKALLRQFGTLENMLKNIDQISKPPLRNKIDENLDQLELSRKLATIERGLDIALDLEEFSISDPSYSDLIPLLQELEFSGMLSEYLDRQDKSDKQYHVILKTEQLHELVSLIKKSKVVSLDTETDSPLPTRARLVGMSFSVTPDQAFYLPLRHDYAGAPSQLSKEDAFNILGPVMSDPKIKKIGQNIKYDLIVLRREGMNLQGIDLDTMVLSYLLEPNWGKHNLGKLALNYLNKKTIPYEEIAGRGKNQVTMNAVDIERVVPYACQDADFAMKLSEKLWPRIKENGLDRIYREFDLPLITVLAEMETWGVKIDPTRLKDLSEEIQESLDRLTGKIFEISGEEFNLNSPAQLATILFEKLGLPTSRRTKKTKGYSTSLPILQDLAQDFPIAQHALEYRQLAKLKSTYADALPLLIQLKTGRIHTSYNQTVAATGRLSSSDPNLQNIPARGDWGPRFRQAFIPEKGHLFLSADYSQIELRVLAHLSKDKGLIETFLQDHDIHQETATRVFADSSTLFPEEQRRRAKIINFSIIYGATAYSLARELGASNAETQAFIDLYYEKYPKVREYLEKSVTEALESGVAKTLFGRKRPVPELRHKDRIAQQFGRRIALNTPIQGTAADLMKKAMIDIWKDIKEHGLGAKMILQVHDELVFEVPKSEVEKTEILVKERMENVYSLMVPLKVHLGWGANWAEAK
jgi:DNA polymerase-1